MMRLNSSTTKWHSYWPLTAQRSEIIRYDDSIDRSIDRINQSSRTGIGHLLQNSMAALLCEAALNNDLECIKRTSLSGVSVNLHDYEKRTPLHIAAAEGVCILPMHTHTHTHTHSLSLSLSVCTTVLFSELSLIDVLQHLECCKLLLLLSADPLACDRWGNTPLDSADEGGHTAISAFLALYTNMPSDASPKSKSLRPKRRSRSPEQRQSRSRTATGTDSIPRVESYHGVERSSRKERDRDEGRDSRERESRKDRERDRDERRDGESRKDRGRERDEGRDSRDRESRKDRERERDEGRDSRDRESRKDRERERDEGRDSRDRESRKDRERKRDEGRDSRDHESRKDRERERGRSDRHDDRSEKGRSSSSSSVSRRTASPSAGSLTSSSKKREISRSSSSSSSSSYTPPAPTSKCPRIKYEDLVFDMQLGKGTWGIIYKVWRIDCGDMVKHSVSHALCD
jgi:hypothetical protein